MDEISSYAVSLREKCKVSFTILQQENRNAGDMDRLKANLGEPTVNDLKGTGNCLNDCDLCIAIYSPLNQKVKNYRGYKIIVENAQKGGFEGMRDRYRAALILKNRYGVSAKAISLNFFGEVGNFKGLPESNFITDYTPYLSLEDTTRLKTDSKDEELTENQQVKKPITFSF